jgi:hypothetical protein
MALRAVVVAFVPGRGEREQVLAVRLERLGGVVPQHAVEQHHHAPGVGGEPRERRLERLHRIVIRAEHRESFSDARVVRRGRVARGRDESGEATAPVPGQDVRHVDVVP